MYILYIKFLHATTMKMNLETKERIELSSVEYKTAPVNVLKRFAFALRYVLCGSRTFNAADWKGKKN